MRFKLLPGFLLPAVIGISSVVASGAEWSAQRLQDFAASTCANWRQTGAPAPGYSLAPVEKSRIIARGRDFGVLHRLRESDGSLLDLEVIESNSQPRRFIATYSQPADKPRFMVSLDAECALQVARRINYAADGRALNLVTLDEKLNPSGEPEWLNPPLQFDAEDAALRARPGYPFSVRVGLIDSGVNYLLPEIRRRLARDRDGALIGYDFWELDDLPFDANLLRSGFFVQRHGTRAASILLREAPAVEFVPYRYPRPDMTRMRDLVEHAARNGVTILGMPLGSNRNEDWVTFAEVAAEHPQMLFVVSAGNNGRDIDRQPVYPAVLELDNMLVVSSADDFVQPADRTNWGPVSVDYLLPAERVAALDYSGKTVEVSGSSYAVPRAVALAARLRDAYPEWAAREIIAELERRYRNDAARDWVSSGYIPDPVAGAPITSTELTPPGIETETNADSLLLPLDLLLLDPRWDRDRYAGALRQAFEILAQCDIVAGEISLRALRGEDYLRDLSTGSAHTLLTAAATRHATVVFARDTRMAFQFSGEAFGFANTARRPWLANSVWLMLDVDDAGIALAHELFHVLANSGAHVEDRPNLMQPRTRPESVELTPEQCQQARSVGKANGLLRIPGT